MALDIAGIIQEHGLFYQDNGQGVKDLRTSFRARTATENVLYRIETKNTKIDRALVTISSVLQAFQKKFTPKGDTKFEPRGFNLDRVKIDVSMWPDDIEQSWLAFLVNSKLDRKTWPIVKYWLTKLVLEQAKEEYELEAIYKGVYVAPTDGVAGTVGQSMNGIRKKINDHVSANRTSTISTGALESDPKLFVDQIEDMIDQIPRKYRRHLETINMEEDKADLFRDGMRLKYNLQYKDISDADLSKIKNQKNISVVGLPSMEGSSKIWTTVKQNGIVAYKNSKNKKIFQLSSQEREVRAFTDYRVGVDFLFPEWLFSNDQDLV